MTVGLKKERIMQVLSILETQGRDTPRIVQDYRMPNVSDKVLRIILSYTDYVNRWSGVHKGFKPKILIKVGL